MAKSKNTPFDLVRNSSMMDLYDAIDDDAVAEDMLSDVVKSAAAFMQAEQQTALALTKLVIENSKNITEDKIFEVFKRAVTEVKTTYQNPFEVNDDE